MAEFKEFKIKVSVDTSDGNKEVEQTIKSLKDYEKILSDLEKKKATPGLSAEELKKLDKEIENLTQSFTEAGNEVKKQNIALEATGANLKKLIKERRNFAAGTKEFQDYTNAINDMKDELKAAGQFQQSFSEQLESAPGPLGRIARGFETLKGATMSWGSAIKASGIGLLVSIVGGITAAFAGNEKATSKLKPVLIGLQRIVGGLFRVFEPLLDSFLEMAEVALPYVTKGIGIFYSALVGLFTYVKEAGTGLAKIYQGIFTADPKKISEGVNQIKNSFATAAQAGTDAYARFTAGTQELTKTEKEELDKRNEQNKKSAEDILQQKKDDIDAQIELEKNKAKTDAKLLEDLLKQKDDLENKGKKLSAKQLELQEQNRKKVVAEALKTDKDAYDQDVENKRKAEEEKYKIVQDNVKNSLNEKEVELERLKIIYGEDSAEYKKQQEIILQARMKALQDEQAYILSKANMTDADAQRLRDISIEAGKISNQVLANQKKETDGLKKKFEDQKALDLEKLNYEMTKAEGDFERQNQLLTQKEELDRQAYEKAVAAASGNTQMLEQIEFNYTKTKDANAKARTDIKKKETDAELELMQQIANGLNAMGDIFGKETAAGKVMSIAASLISTYAAIAKQLEAFAGVPIPGYAIAQAVATGLVGFKSVRDIMMVQVPTQDVPEVRIRKALGGVLQGPTHAMGGIATNMGELEGGEYVVNRMATQLFRPALDKINGFGGNIDYEASGFGGQVTASEPPIIKTYVVASEMSSQQELDRIIRDRSKI